MKEKENFCNKCYECTNRGGVPGSAHSSCKANPIAKVKGNDYGRRSGWFFFPYDFDPVWLEECNSFESKS